MLLGLDKNENKEIMLNNSQWDFKETGPHMSGFECLTKRYKGDNNTIKIQKSYICLYVMHISS